MKSNWNRRFHLGDTPGNEYGIECPWEELWGLINVLLSLGSAFALVPPKRNFSYPQGRIIFVEIRKSHLSGISYTYNGKTIFSTL